MATITMTVTTAGLNWLRMGFTGSNTIQINYVAVGTGTTAPTVNDTKLAAEAYRVPPAGYTLGSNGVISMNGFIDTAYANVSISELGLFGSMTGNTATGTANTGVLLARGLWSPAFVKTNADTISLPFIITLV